jgi:hypothetical protein
MEQLLNLLQSNNINTNDYNEITFFLLHFLKKQERQLVKSGSSEYNAIRYQIYKKTDPTFSKRQRMFAKRRMESIKANPELYNEFKKKKNEKAKIKRIMKEYLFPLLI